MQEVCDPVAAALLKRMNAMSKMHVASVVVSLLFGNQSLQSSHNSAQTQQKNLHCSQQPSEANTDSWIPQNLNTLAEVVRRMLPALQQMGLVDHTVPCSLAHVLLNPEVTCEQENAAVSLLSVLNCNQETASSITATLGHAPKDGLKHLQQSTVTALETICSVGLASGTCCTFSSVLYDCLLKSGNIGTGSSLLQARRECSSSRPLREILML